MIAERDTTTSRDTDDAWVERRFLALGFSPDQARDLRHAGADWHQAQRLLDQGCSLEHATQILT